MVELLQKKFWSNQSNHSYKTLYNQYIIVSMYYRFITVFITLFLYPIINGYPIIFYDTRRYFSGILLEFHTHAMQFPTLFIIPFYKLAGVWGWCFFNIAISAYMVSLLSVKISKKLPLIITILAIFFSAYGVISACLCMDFLTTIGLISLFIILFYKPTKTVYFFFLLASTAHYGNILLFFLANLFYFFIKKESAKKVFLVLLIALLVNGSYRSILAKENVFFPRVGSVFVAARIMNSIPQSITEYSNSYKNSFIAKNKNELLKLATLPKHSIAHLLYGVSSPLKLRHLDFSREARHYVFFTLKKYPLENLLAIKNSFFKLLFASGPIYYPEVSVYKKTVKLIDPNGTKKFLSSLIVQKKYNFFENSLLKKKLLFLCIIISSLGILFKRDFLDIKNFAIFALLTLLLNCLVMSSLSGPFFRYLVRVQFLVYLSGFIYSYLFIKDLTSKVLKQAK